MQRVTISLDESLAEAFDQLATEQGYGSRSEAVRDLVRKAIATRREAAASDGDCVANLSYVYNHHVRTLAQRLTELSHQHHDLVVATIHIHLDHEHCLESVMLKGRTDQVRSLADAIRAERGVRFGELNLIAVAPNGDHGPAADHRHGKHEHLTPELE
ncbi:nickel-responsive transcriptional regulator NikR [uncultured Phenylobacterium sp.]|uniref:nickel-responsive transcriptional regulator NikR n=1 Tax=uncultured Phenylobacterium sp. TaxID=349273 RepID=UPI0025F34173|nr:nickel-responsive transcriptional regulator NikR [uncultured Phenylobacterium sp.]